MAVISARVHEHTAIAGKDTMILAVLLIVPVIVFDQFLHTSPSALSGSLGDEFMYCASDTLLGLPLAAAAVWAGNRIVDRWEFGSRSGWGVFVRAGVITLGLSLFLIPGWFLHDPADALAHATAVVSASGHAGHDEVHWASDTVFYILILIPVASAAVWGGDRVGRRLRRGQGGGSSFIVRLGMIAVLLALALPSAWFLEQGANRADTSAVTYNGAAFSGHHAHALVPTNSKSKNARDGRFTRAHLALLLPVQPTPAALHVVYDFAHALRDGLAGQAVGLPVMFLVLLWRIRRRPLGWTPGWGNT